MHRLLVLTLLVASVAAKADGAETPKLASMLWSEEAGFRLVEGSLTATADTVAWANYTNAINQTGWSYLEVNTDKSFPDKVQVMMTQCIRSFRGQTVVLVTMNYCGLHPVPASSTVFSKCPHSRHHSAALHAPSCGGQFPPLADAMFHADFCPSLVA